ncbi:nuclease-related domain-containing protein [Nitrospira sp. Nam74]
MILSDYREEQLRLLRAEREQRYQQARVNYQQELRAYDEEVSALAETSHTAFRRLRLVHGIGAWWRHRTLFKRGDPPPPLLEGPSVEEQRLQTEAEADQRLAADLLAALPGRAWMLLKGYQNQKGNIDYLLIGPVGVVALECQHLSGTIICAKDRWMRQKYDPKGAPATQVPILDRNGRTPSQQLNEPVAELIERLSQKDVTCEISRAIILTHQDVRLSTAEPSTVQIVLLANVQPFLWELCRSASSFVPTERIVEFVKEDHHYWHQRKGPTLQEQRG